MFIDLFMERMNIMAAIVASKSSSGGGSTPEPDPEPGDGVPYITSVDFSDVSLYESGHWYKDKYNFVIKQVNANRTRLVNIYAVKPNTTYKIDKFAGLSWLIRLCYSSPDNSTVHPTFISTVNKTSGTFTTPSNCDRIAVSWMTEASETTIQRIRDGQIPVITEVG